MHGVGPLVLPAPLRLAAGSFAGLGAPVSRATPPRAPLERPPTPPAAARERDGLGGGGGRLASAGVPAGSAWADLDDDDDDDDDGAAPHRSPPRCSPRRSASRACSHGGSAHASPELLSACARASSFAPPPLDLASIEGAARARPLSSRRPPGARGAADE
jgi:hypothetical protein